MLKNLIIFSTFLIVASILGCGPQEKYVTLNINAVKSGSTQSDMDMAYKFISNIRNPENTIIIYDASGSMLWPTSTNGKPRYKTAIESFNKFVDKINPKNNVGLLVYGSNSDSGIYHGNVQNASLATQSCNNDIETVVSLSKFDQKKYDSALAKFSNANAYKGDTPIGNAIMKAANILKDVKGNRKHIILITDGEEECYGKVKGAISPTSAIKFASDNNIRVSIVAFGIGKGKNAVTLPDAKKTLQKLKNLTTGVFVQAASGEELLDALIRQELDNFPFNIIDNKGVIIAQASIGTTARINIAPYYFTDFTKIKLTISAVGEKTFTKNIAITPSQSNYNIYLGFRSDNDIDPIFEPANLLVNN